MRNKFTKIALCGLKPKTVLDQRTERLCGELLILNLCSRNPPRAGY